MELRVRKGTCKWESIAYYTVYNETLTPPIVWVYDNCSNKKT